MKRWERLAAIVLFLVGVGAACGAWQIGFGSFQSPGPGFFPFWLSVTLAVLCAVFFGRNLGKDDKKVVLWSAGAWHKPLRAASVMFVYVFLIGRLGFISSTAILFFAWLRFVEHSSWKSVVLLVVLGTAALHLFTSLLAIPLPKGLLI